MKRYWSLRQIPAFPGLDRRPYLARWHAVSLRLQRHGQAWLGLLACALLAALGRALGLGHPGSIVTALAGAQCYCHVYLHMARRHCRRLLIRSDGAEVNDADRTALQ
ncbi:hypothetical protein HBDW_40710 [Herbaspirillum sp. DW155]|uniref:hypothetical protein n=1 Tax=Herbaspirillum sp. DW155 TaxID=3095609 RepID=UPI00308D716B|nr:hypothetical protein HBDW_40710 [Herbaspirillum sp. DW155]